MKFVTKYLVPTTALTRSPPFGVGADCGGELESKERHFYIVLGHGPEIWPPGPTRIKIFSARPSRPPGPARKARWKFFSLWVVYSIRLALSLSFLCINFGHLLFCMAANSLAIASKKIAF
jgi:hypothetical protein